MVRPLTHMGAAEAHAKSLGSEARDDHGRWTSGGGGRGGSAKPHVVGGLDVAAFSHNVPQLEASHFTQPGASSALFAKLPLHLRPAPYGPLPQGSVKIDITHKGKDGKFDRLQSSQPAWERYKEGGATGGAHHEPAGHTPTHVAPIPSAGTHDPSRHSEPRISAPGASTAPHHGTGAEVDAKAQSFLTRGEKMDAATEKRAYKRVEDDLHAHLKSSDPAGYTAFANAFGGSGSEESRVRAGIRKTMNDWLTTTGDSNARALAMQKAVSDVMGSSQSWQTMRTVATNQGDWFGDPRKAISKAEQIDSQHGRGYRALARSIYANTQAQLKEHGITEVTLHRGMAFPGGQTPSWSGSKEHAVPFQPVSSWATHSSVARGFATFGNHDGGAYLVSARVPATRIFSTGRTGLGDVGSNEFHVLAGPGKVGIEKIA